MRTNNEKIIEIQNILTISDVHPADCNKILDLIIELSKEKKQPKAYTNHNYDKAKQSQQENNQLKLINKEHQQINGELRQANKLLNEQYIRLYKDYMQLKAQIEEYQKALDETMYEKIDIENNWNKLKEWVNKHYDYYINNEDYIGGRLCFIDMKDKMQELEQGSDSNE